MISEFSSFFIFLSREILSHLKEMIQTRISTRQGASFFDIYYIFRFFIRVRLDLKYKEVVDKIE